MRHAFAGSTGGEKDKPQTALRFGVRRIEPDSFGQFNLGFGHLVQAGKHNAEVRPRRGIIGSEFADAAEFGQGSISISLFDKGHGITGVGAGRIGRSLGGAGQVAGCVVQTSQREKGRAFTEKRLRRVRLNAEQHIETFNGLLVSTGLPQDAAEVVFDDRVLGGYGQRAPEERLAIAPVSELSRSKSGSTHQESDGNSAQPKARNPEARRDVRQPEDGAKNRPIEGR